jgi:hypothetical protein
MGTGKILEADIELHLALPIKKDLDGPPTLPATILPEVYGGWLPAGEKLIELIWKFLSAERVIGDVDDELKVHDERGGRAHRRW